MRNNKSLIFKSLSLGVDIIQQYPTDLNVLIYNGISSVRYAICVTLSLSCPMSKHKELFSPSSYKLGSAHLQYHTFSLVPLGQFIISLIMLSHLSYCYFLIPLITHNKSSLLLFTLNTRLEAGVYLFSHFP